MSMYLGVVLDMDVACSRNLSPVHVIACHFPSNCFPFLSTRFSPLCHLSTTTASCGVHSQPLMTHLVMMFSRAPHSPLLYCASICVTEFGLRGPEYAALLFQMLDNFCITVFKVLKVNGYKNGV